MNKLLRAHAARACLFLFCFLLLPSFFLHAQQTLGSINGAVTDASGAAVSGATVTVTDAAEILDTISWVPSGLQSA